MSRRLPEALFKALEERLNLAPLATLRSGYAALSRDYRSRTVSEEERQDLADGPAPGSGGRAPGAYTRAQARALGYLAARFPATHAAVSAALDQVPDAALDGCSSVLDLGAGPGTATWALATRLPGLAQARLLESNAEMIAHAQALALAFGGLKATLHSGDLAEQLALSGPADLVVMAYVLSELDESIQKDLLAAAWAKARRGVFLLEPGTPEATRRVLAARAQWLGLGGRMVAPCPQSGPCPMDPARATTPGWCHFSVRLERRGLHKAVKGGELGYEDEKYTWIFVSKDQALPAPAPYRLHSDPRRVNRNITLDVCDAAGQRRSLFYKRRDTDAGLRQAARRLQWGDAWNPDAVPPASGPEED